MLLVVGLGVLFASGGVLSTVGGLGLAVLATGVGVALLLGPWIVRLWRDLGDGAARAHPLRGAVRDRRPPPRLGAADAGPHPAGRRARPGAHAWPAGRSASCGPGSSTSGRPTATGAPATLGAALERVVTEVEDRHDVEVDLVVVGDCPLEPRLDALVAAVREAAHNAARHAGVAEVSVYVEVEPQRVTAYVRDRGRGFDPRRRRAGRVGMRESIVGRMARHGGRAEVHTAPGEGTEVGPGGRPDAGSGGRRGVTRRGCSWSTTTRCSAPGCGPSWATRVEVVGEAADVESAVEGIRATDPEVVLLDVHLPAAAARRCWRPSSPSGPTSCSWPCRCPTPPRT